MSMREDFDALREWAKERRGTRLELNEAALAECGIPFERRPSACLFRVPGLPKADFYPGTGRWRVAGDSRTHSGGARKFLAWYAAQGGK